MQYAKEILGQIGYDWKSVFITNKIQFDLNILDGLFSSWRNI